MTDWRGAGKAGRKHIFGGAANKALHRLADQVIGWRSKCAESMTQVLSDTLFISVKVKCMYEES